MPQRQPDQVQDSLLRALHDAHAPSLVRFVTRLTDDRALAEDIVQETLLRAWRHPEVLERGEDATRAWLFTVARNLVIDDRRSARFSRELSTDEVPERAREDDTDALLDAWLVADALASLSIEHRTVVVRAYYLGHSVAEIGATRGIPDGTVEVLPALRDQGAAPVLSRNAG